MTRWILAAAVVCGADSLGPRPAVAAEPASFEWNAPLSCPTRGAMLERLGQGGPSGAARPIDTRVTVEQYAEDHYRARVDLVVGHQWSDQSLEASTCESIADAVVVIVRVAAAAAPADPLPAVAPPAISPPVAPAPAPPVPSPAPPATAPSAVPSSASEALADEDRGRGFSVRAAFAVDAGSRYDATPGFAIAGAWRGAHVAFALDFRAFAPAPPEAPVPPATVPLSVPGLAGTSTGLFAAGTGVAVFAFPDEHVWLLTASAEACASEPLRRPRVLLDACLGLVLEHPRFDGFAELGIVPMGELGVEWWPLRALGVRGSTRWLLDVPRQAQGNALIAFEPSLGLVMSLGK